MSGAHQRIPMLAALAVILLGCTPDPQEPEVEAAIPEVTEDPAGPAPGALPTEDPPFETFEGTTSPIAVGTERVEPITLSDVRASSREEHDRVVFEFLGGELPGYEIGYLEGPRVTARRGGRWTSPATGTFASVFRPPERRTRVRRHSARERTFPWFDRVA